MVPKIDEGNEIFVVKSVKSMIKNPSKKSQITIFKHSKYRMKVQFWCENWLIRWFSNYVRITNLWGFLKLSFRRYSYLGQNNCLCLRSRVVAWSCFDEQIRRKSWFTLWWFVVVVISSLAFMFCPHFEDWWSYIFMI